MKQTICKCTVIALLSGLFMLPHDAAAQASDFSIEKVSKECKGIPRDKRIRVRVARFSVSSRAAQATGQFGEELTTIMTHAINQINCYRVLETIDKKEDANAEIAENESGATNGNGAQRGKKLSAQAIITAEITEYNEGKTGVDIIFIKVGKDKAKLGLIIKLVDPETSEILWSKSVNGEAAKSGFGIKTPWTTIVTSSKVSEAMSAAVEDIVMKTVTLLVKEKADIESMLPNPADGLAKPKSWNAENCTMLKSGNAPKVMVIVPEKHINAAIPDPAGETEILRKLTEAGFRAIDPAMFATLRHGVRFDEAMKNPMAAASLGKEFGADVVIFGEAFSQLVSRESNTVSCRARVEVKAVRTDNAEILATNGLQAGGQDIAESTAAKTALRNAGGQVADYLLGQFCSKNLALSTPSLREGFAPTSNANSNMNKTTIAVSNVNFAKLNSLATSLKSNNKVKDIQKSLSGTEGTLSISYDGSTDELAELINSNLAAQFDITGVEQGKISLTGK
jgi:curli biogenesis system outer membrane secretion channel CsgG